MRTLMKYGLRSCLGLALLCSASDFSWASVPSDGVANENEDILPGEMRVGEATKTAEGLVRTECMRVLAPKYCSAKKIPEEDCKADSWCKTLVPEGRVTKKTISELNAHGQFKKHNVVDTSENNNEVNDAPVKKDVGDVPGELRAQVEAQIMACIAEKRDPNARKTGRPEYRCVTKTPIPWCSMNSPSWREDILWPEDDGVKEERRANYLRIVKPV